MTDQRDTDVTRIIAETIADWDRRHEFWSFETMADQIVIALHEAGYVIARIPETTDSPTGGLS